MPFTKAVFIPEFAEGRDIASEAVLQAILVDLGLDAPRLMALSNEAQVKERLRAATAEAERLGIFGAPRFVTEDGELFWGDDRLAPALVHAKSGS